MVQPSGDGHGVLALVGDVGGGAEEGVRRGDSAVVIGADGAELQASLSASPGHGSSAVPDAVVLEMWLVRMGK
jgi:hypothetical protein